MDISVIIVNWNTRDILSQCLNSLRNHPASYPMEVIVVDNASSDGSAELVREKFPEVRLIVNKENCGFAKGNNIGIQQSSGKYVCIMNSDVLVLEDTLNRMYDYMEANPRIGILGPKFYRDMERTGIDPTSCRKFPTIWNKLCEALALHKLFPGSEFFSTPEMDYFAHDSIKKVEVIAGTTWMVRRTALDEVGLMDESFFMYGEDLDWCKRFWDHGWEVLFFPEALAIHFGRSSSSKEPVRFHLEQQRSAMRYWRKHHGITGVFCIHAIGLLHHAIRLLGQMILYSVKKKERSQLAGKIVCNSRALLFYLGLPRK